MMKYIYTIYIFTLNMKHSYIRVNSQTPDTSQSTDRGQLKVSLQFNITNDTKQKGDLVVTIISGHNLLQTELTCNPVVKWWVVYWLVY